ncbi:MAG: DNA-processing protein DprA [Rickettsiales bacterium]|jgi:DNA processing protein|nr:DNA-processing protein DprA [Rickettsiales bacterium]
MEEKLNIMRLANCRGINKRVIIGLIARNGFSIEKTLENISRFKSPVVVPGRNEVEDDLMRSEEKGIKIITFREREYPKRLMDVGSFPLVLHCRGNIGLLDAKKPIAIIGSRNSSVNNYEFAKKTARELEEYGYTVISGMAKCIDAAAHAGALKTGTAAVLGSGVDYIYPEENTRLYYDIIKNGGLIVSEYKTGTRPLSEFFPQRNRIIAGLSKGVVVICAGEHSGTKITVSIALECGREAMVFPSCPYDDRGAGSNEMLKEGATLVTCTEDIVETMETFLGRKKIARERDEITEDNELVDEIPADNEDEILLSKLDYIPLSFDSFLRSCENDERLKKNKRENIISLVVKWDLEEKIVFSEGKISLRIDPPPTETTRL